MGRGVRGQMREPRVGPKRPDQKELAFAAGRSRPWTLLGNFDPRPSLARKAGVFCLHFIFEM